MSTETVPVTADRKILAEQWAYAAEIDGEWGCAHSAEQIQRGECQKYNLDIGYGLPLLLALAWRESKARERAARYANGEIPATTEYGTVMSGGGVQTRPNDPALERAAPLAEWIHLQRTVNRSRVVRRRIIVIDDWTEVTEP